MSLQEVLREFKAGVAAKLPAEDVALMDEATEALIRSGIAEKAMKIGEMAPDFTLPNTSGELVKLSDLLAHGPVVVTFYRGTW
jgi:AhpC/TSA family